jgi:hypothetical protein
MTTQVALLGHPVAHSRSPGMQNAAFCMRGESECATGWPSSATSSAIYLYPYWISWFTKSWKLAVK